MEDVRCSYCRHLLSEDELKKAKRTETPISFNDDGGSVIFEDTSVHYEFICPNCHEHVEWPPSGVAV